MDAWLLNLFNLTGLVDGAETANLAFESPVWLWLIVFWPLFWWLSSRFTANNDLSDIAARRQLQVRHALIHKVQHIKPIKQITVFSFRAIIFNLLRGLAISLIAIALAQPIQKLPTPSEPDSKTVRDIVFVVESSASFLLPDYAMNGQQETRMNVVKQVLDDFIAKLEGNRFSLAIYADSAYTLLPLTSDQTLARLTLKRLQPYLAGRTDTAMGEALGLALKQADQSTGVTKASTDTLKRVLVLISDGLSQPSKIELTEAVNYAQLLQVPIYTIGVGASSEQADKRVYTGLLYQPLESESLQSIAQQTGGQYYQVGSGAEISAVLEQINQAEGVPYIQPPSPPQKQDLSPYPLIAGLVILGIYWLLSLIWTGVVLRKPKQGNDEEAA
ncbi:VWA domain-containing protein [Thiomicrorhabdus sp. Kp2]|uniref:vWA domain-containing protein n=1 Tax=Thiomicrorhabdus sp. Kp2 TaxID=1123518 RepID=UPI0004017041|nr:VWA domain-containing protein [Thiomicrorhabdus sp. Kp2]